MDGRIGVADIAALRLNTDLVVLSACRTLGGVIVTGEGLQGLTAPVLEAGARAVAATYWAVGDRSIQPLIERFYRGMREGLSAGDALARAKRASFLAGESPNVWAAFSLTGDARVRPPVF
jgi:CHAT domain-containing protein